MMSFALQFVGSPKKFNVHLCKRIVFCPRLLSLGCASARKLNSDEKDALFGLDGQITICFFKFMTFFDLPKMSIHGSMNFSASFSSITMQFSSVVVFRRSLWNS
jgi:hypothetical protein